MRENKVNQMNQLLRNKYKTENDSIKTGITPAIPTLDQARSKRSSLFRNVVIKNKIILGEDFIGYAEKPIPEINLIKNNQGVVATIEVKCACGEVIQIGLEY